MTIWVNELQKLCEGLPTQRRLDSETVLVTGAAGYIGGRLVTELIARGYRVRVMVRADQAEFAGRWPGSEVTVADALKPDELMRALEGVHAAYYLIHSMLIGPKMFEEADLTAARHFCQAAEKQGIERVIYLGGLGDVRKQLSSHLDSRSKVALELASGSVPVTCLRAAIIIGSGSASYEMIHHLVRKVPLLPVPGWATTRCQPISLRDVIKYLVGVLELPDTAGQTFDIGGPDILTYKQLLQTHADILGKRRFFMSVPVSSIRFYSYVTSLLTPVPDAITRCLMESVLHDVVCEENRITGYLPFRCLSCREALVRALSREEQDAVHTRWTDSYPPHHELAIKLNELDAPPTFTSTYSLVTQQPAVNLFNSFSQIGGEHGWFNSTFLWRIRGEFDRLLQGVGTTRGRRSPSRLRVNDVVDFWRVEQIHPPSQLLLRAEMKLPGYAWLEFRVDEAESPGGRRKLSVNAYYRTQGLWGRLYWYIFLPFHHFIFYDLIRQIERAAGHPAQRSRSGAGAPPLRRASRLKENAGEHSDQKRLRQNRQCSIFNQS